MAEPAVDLPPPILGKEKAKKFLKALGSQNKYVKEQKINPSPLKERDQSKKKEEKKTPIQKARETRDEIEALKQNVKISPFKTPMPCFKDSILIHHITADMAGESSSTKKTIEFSKDTSGDTETEKKLKSTAPDAVKTNSNNKDDAKSDDERKTRILPARYNLEKRFKSNKKNRSRSRERRDRSKSKKRFQNNKKEDASKKRDPVSRKSSSNTCSILDQDSDKTNSFFLKWTKVQPPIVYMENPKTIQHIKNDLLIMTKLDRKQIKRKLRMEMKREKLLKRDKEKLRRRKKSKRGKNKKPDSDKSSSVDEKESKKKRRKKRRRSKTRKSSEALTPKLNVENVIVDSNNKSTDVILKSDPKSPDTDEYMSNWEDESNNCNAFSEINLDTIPLRLPTISDRPKILIKTDEEKMEKPVEKSDIDDKQTKIVENIFDEKESEVTNEIEKEKIDTKPPDCIKAPAKPKEVPQIEDLYNEYEQFIMSCMTDEKEAEERKTANDDADGKKKELPQIHSTENDFEQSFASTDNEDQLEQLKRNLEQQIYEIDSTGRFSLDEADEEEEEEPQPQQQQQQQQQQEVEKIQPSTSSLKRKSSTSTTTSSSESTEPPGGGNAASSTSSIATKKKRSAKKKKKRKRSRKSSLITAWNEDVPSDEELLSMVEQLKQNFMEKRIAKASKRKNKREPIDTDEPRSETPPLERRLKETNKILMEQVIEPQVGMISSTNSNSLASEIINTKVTRTCKGVFPINDLALEDVAKLASDAKKMNLAASVANSKAEMEGYLNVVTIMKCDSFTINSNQEMCKLIDAKEMPIVHVSIKSDENKEELNDLEIDVPKETAAPSDDDQTTNVKENEEESKDEAPLDAVTEFVEIKNEQSPIVQQQQQNQQQFKSSDDKRSASPMRRLSPRKRSISPLQKRNRTPPRKRSRSPRKRTSHSPRKRSRSPRKRSRSPRRRSRSPRKRSRSPRKRTPSPRRRRSRSPRRYSSPSRHSIRNSISPQRKISRISTRRSNSPVGKFWTQSYDYASAYETDHRFTATENSDWQQQPESHVYSDYAAYAATSQPQHNIYPSDQHQQQQQHYSNIPVLDHQGSEFFFANMEVQQQQQHHVHISNLIEIKQSPLRPPSIPFALQKGNVLEIVPKKELPATVPAAICEPQTSTSSDKQTEDDKLLKLESEKRKELKLKKAQEKETRRSDKLQRKEKMRQQIKQLELELATMKKKEVEIVSKRIFVYDPNAQCGKSILRYTDPVGHGGKKKVSFADGKTPGDNSSSAEDEEVPIPLPLQDKMKKKLLKTILSKDHGKGKALVLDNIKSYVDPELWNMTAPPPPASSPPVQLMQPKLKKSDDSIPKLIYFHYNRFDHTMYVSPFPTLDPNQIKNQSSASSSGSSGTSTAATSNTASNNSTTNNLLNKTQHSEAPKVCFIQPPTFPQPPPPPPPFMANMQYPVPPFGQSSVPPYAGNTYPPSPHYCGPNAATLPYGPRPPPYMQTSPFMPAPGSPFMSPQTPPFMSPHIPYQPSAFGMAAQPYPGSPSPNMMGPFNPRQPFTPPSRQMRPPNAMYSPSPPPQPPGQSPHRAIPPKMFDHMNKSIRHRSISPKYGRWDISDQPPPSSRFQWNRMSSPAVTRPFAGGSHPSPRPPMPTNFMSGHRPRMSLPFQSPLPPPQPGPTPSPQSPYASNPSPSQSHAP